MADTIIDNPEPQPSPPPLLAAKYISIERRNPSDTVFLVDDTPFHRTMPQPTHWSIAWSDLMMTMFVLFLAMFVYQSTNREFLAPQTPEVVAGDTADALAGELFAPGDVPFALVSPGLPLITGGSVPEAATITLQNLDMLDGTPLPAPNSAPQLRPQAQPPPQTTAEDGQQLPPADHLREIYLESKERIVSNDLARYASVVAESDNAVRITLASELFFSGDTTTFKLESLAVLAAIIEPIRTSPYQITVSGHTSDTISPTSPFPSTWELSVAQASAVARFMIEEMRMNPSLFAVSGYASYQPRITAGDSSSQPVGRVEILIKQRPPQVVVGGANLSP